MCVRGRHIEMVAWCVTALQLLLLVFAQHCVASAYTHTYTPLAHLILGFLSHHVILRALLTKGVGLWLRCRWTGSLCGGS